MKEEIEKLNYIIDKQDRDIVALSNGNRKLKDKILKLETDVSIYKDLSNLRQEKINKALEYINSDKMLELREEFEYCNDKDLFDGFAGHLDRILRGSDKE